MMHKRSLAGTYICDEFAQSEGTALTTNTVRNVGDHQHALPKSYWVYQDAVHFLLFICHCICCSVNGYFDA